MFKTNPDPMRMEPTPERVYSLCRLVAYKKMTKEELLNALTLGSNDEKAKELFQLTLSVALDELHILHNKDNYIELLVSKEVLSSPSSFRRHISGKVFHQTDTTFFLFTKWLISQNDKIFNLTNWEVIAKTCADENRELSKINENAVLGWRFWATYLGLGYLSGTMFLPNMKIRLQDLLATEFQNSFPYDEAIRANEFIAWLGGQMPEIDFSGKLPLALSSALRTMDELGLIKLETRRDSNNIRLFYVEGDCNDFSHITVRKAVC